MKKKILVTIGIMLGIMLLDSSLALVFNNNPIIKIKEYYNGGDLNYISKSLLVDTYNCVNGKKDTVIKGFSYSCNLEEDITLNDVKVKIDEYFGNENVDRSNLAYTYLDNENNVVVVGLIDNTKEKQQEFINSVFSNCCGSKYIKYVTDNSMIEFIKTEKNTTSINKIEVVKGDVYNLNKFNKYLEIDNRVIYISPSIEEVYYYSSGVKHVLKDYISKTYQTVDDAIKDLTDMMELVGIYKDGGTTIYKSKEYDIAMVKCNTVDKNRNIYVGDYKMVFDSDLMCK